MTGHNVKPAATERIVAVGESIYLKVQQLGHERGYGRLKKRIACSDVHFLHFIGQTVDDCLKQSFIAEYDSRAASVGYTLWCEPLTDVSGLYVLSWGADVCELSRRLFGSVLNDDCTASVLKTADKHLLHLMQEVEAYEDVCVVVGRQGVGCGHLLVEGSFVCKTLT